jgi:hypothetical protein
MSSSQDHKDRIRHGGKRKILLERFGPVCSMCGEQFENRKIAVHHLRDKTDHEFQILLCFPCHTKLHGGTERKPVSPEELLEAINSSSTLTEVQKKFGLSKHGLQYKREKYGLLEKPCSECKKMYKPKKGFPKYCSLECAEVARKKKELRSRERNKETKRKADKLYYEKHRIELIAKQKEYYEKNRDKVLEYHKELYLNKKLRGVAL